MTTIQSIQNELITGYESVSLPDGLGNATGYQHEPVSGFASEDLPAVVVTRAVLVDRTQIGVDRYRYVREYIVDLFAYTRNPNLPINTTERDSVADCIDAIADVLEALRLDTSGVIYHDFLADTADVSIDGENSLTQYIGARFRHQVTYIGV